MSFRISWSDNHFSFHESLEEVKSTILETPCYNNGAGPKRIEEITDDGELITEYYCKRSLELIPFQRPEGVYEDC